MTLRHKSSEKASFQGWVSKKKVGAVVACGYVHEGFDGDGLRQETETCICMHASVSCGVYAGGERKWRCERDMG